MFAAVIYALERMGEIDTDRVRDQPNPAQFPHLTVAPPGHPHAGCAGSNTSSGTTTSQRSQRIRS